MYLPAALLRGLLIVYAEYHDHHSPVAYTDIDYVVYSDAAAHIAQGWSPYERSTYRYTPFLAAVLVPNSVVHPAWGKALFTAADLLIARSDALIWLHSDRARLGTRQLP